MIHPEFTLTLIWKNNLIEKTLLQPADSGTTSCMKTSPRPSRALGNLYRHYLNREPLHPEIPLAWKNMPPFRARVLRTLFWLVPWGRIVTYSGLAAMAGNPGAARAVGTAMACNPWPVIIPCHRVIRADRGLGGFSCGTELKKKLLALEDIIRNY